MIYAMNYQFATDRFSLDDARWANGRGIPLYVIDATGIAKCVPGRGSCSPGAAAAMPESSRNRALRGIRVE